VYWLQDARRADTHPATRSDPEPEPTSQRRRRGRVPAAAWVAPSTATSPSAVQPSGATSAPVCAKVAPDPVSAPEPSAAVPGNSSSLSVSALRGIPQALDWLISQQ